MEDSIFTKIIKGEISDYRIYEDELSIVILDVHPQLPGHALVIPKQQVDHIWDLPDNVYHHLWDIVKKVGAKQKQVFNSPRVGIVVEGFGVPHVHIHVLPLYNDKDINRPQDLEAEPNHAELAKIAEKLVML